MPKRYTFESYPLNHPMSQVPDWSLEPGRVEGLVNNASSVMRLTGVAGATDAEKWTMYRNAAGVEDPKDQFIRAYRDWGEIRLGLFQTITNATNGARNGYEVLMDSNATYVIQNKNGVGNAIAGTSAPTGAAHREGDLGLRAVLDSPVAGQVTLYWFLNGVQQGSFVDTNPPTNLLGGFRSLWIESIYGYNEGLRWVETNREDTVRRPNRQTSMIV